MSRRMTDTQQYVDTCFFNERGEPQTFIDRTLAASISHRAYIAGFQDAMEIIEKEMYLARMLRPQIIVMGEESNPLDLTADKLARFKRAAESSEQVEDVQTQVRFRVKGDNIHMHCACVTCRGILDKPFLVVETDGIVEKFLETHTFKRTFA